MTISKYFLAAAVLGVLPSCKGLFDSEVGGPCTTTLTAGDDIQDAINNANDDDVICLGAGEYKPSGRIDINKPIELRGPQSNVDPRTSCGSARTDETSEAVVDGEGTETIFEISADDVTIDGLTIKNASGDMIESESAIANANIRFNIITEATDEGIQLRNCDSCVVEYNLVFDITQDGINMCCGSSNGVIRFNEVYDIGSDNAAIYVYNADSISITDNYVYDVSTNDGIKMGGSNCNGNYAPNGSIERNVVRDTVQDGITVYSSNTVVMDNEIYGSNSINGALYITCADTQNVTVTGNAIYNNGGSTDGVRIGSSITNTNTGSILVNNNCIQGNDEGMVNLAATAIDATENWWGASNGPGGEGTGNGDTVSVNVDFSPFLMIAPEKCQSGNLFSDKIDDVDFLPEFCPAPPPPIEFPEGCEGDYVKPKECLGVLTMLSGDCVLYFDDDNDIQELGASNEMDCINLLSCSAESSGKGGKGGKGGKHSGESVKRNGKRDLRINRKSFNTGKSSQGSTNTGSLACNYNSKEPSTVGLSLSPDNDEVCGNVQSFKLVCTNGPPEFSVTCPLDAYPFVSAGGANIEVMPEGFASTTATYAPQPTASFVINDAEMTMYDLAIGCADKICVDTCLAAATVE